MSLLSFTHTVSQKISMPLFFSVDLNIKSDVEKE